MKKNYDNFTNIGSLLEALAEALNLLNPDVKQYHEQVAYIACVIAKEMGFDHSHILMSLYAATLHDVGDIVWDNPNNVSINIKMGSRLTAIRGSRMLQDLPGYSGISEIIRYCQDRWILISNLLDREGQVDNESIKVAAVVHLAIWISKQLNDDEPVLNQAAGICEKAEKWAGMEFMPEAVEALLRIKSNEYVWMNAMYNPAALKNYTGNIRVISLEETVRLTTLMSRIIDFRSPFTAMHSAGVAASARKLAEIAGMTDEECMMMEIAGNLHDVGKIKVPKSILEKPGRLTDEEFNVIKEHAYFTKLILEQIDGFDQIAAWAGNHHEKLNGRGYPFHYDASQLDLGSRIMAVADIFSAITEERPYRKPMSREMAMKIMHENVEFGAISEEIVQLLEDHYDEVDEVRDRLSKEAGKRYFDSLESA